MSFVSLILLAWGLPWSVGDAHSDIHVTSHFLSKPGRQLEFDPQNLCDGEKREYIL